MIIAGFDTVTDMLTVAVADEEQTIAEESRLAPRAHMSLLLPILRDVLGRAGLTFADVDYLAVGVGPGSFTGTRIGVATAQGLALASHSRLVGISTLDVLAAQVVAPAGVLVCPVIDAKRKEVYTGLFPTEEASEELAAPLVTTASAWAAELSKLGRRILFVGDGLCHYKEVFASVLGDNAVFADESLWYPSAGVLIELAKAIINRGDFQPYHEVLPIYTRLSDAEEALLRLSK